MVHFIHFMQVRVSIDRSWFSLDLYPLASSYCGYDPVLVYKLPAVLYFQHRNEQFKDLLLRSKWDPPLLFQ